MNHEEYNYIINTFKSCTPSECITKMFEMTDENGLLCIPAWPSDYDLDQAGAYYALKMNWSREDAESLIEEHTKLVDQIAKLAEKWKNDELDTSPVVNCVLLDSDLFEVWNTFIRTLAPKDMDFMKFYDIAEKIEQIAVREADKNDAQFAPGSAAVSFDPIGDSDEISVSLDEMKYYNEYIDRVNEEAKRRLGGKYANYDVIIRASRLCKLMAQEAPQIIIDNESRLLVQAMAVGRFAAEMKEKKL